MHCLTIVNKHSYKISPLQEKFQTNRVSNRDQEKNQSKTFRYIVNKPEDPNWGVVLHTADFAQTPPMASYPPSEHPRPYSLLWDKGRVLKDYFAHPFFLKSFPLLDYRKHGNS